MGRAPCGGTTPGATLPPSPGTESRLSSSRQSVNRGQAAARPAARPPFLIARSGHFCVDGARVFFTSILRFGVGRKPEARSRGGGISRRPSDSGVFVVAHRSQLKQVHAGESDSSADGPFFSI
jgi:hypothetical protein